MLTNNLEYCNTSGFFLVFPQVISNNQYDVYACMYVFTSKHPRVSLYAAGFVTFTAGVHTYMKSETKALKLVVYKELEKGSCRPTNNAMVPRREISKEILDLFFPYSEECEVDENRQTFRFVVGPTGTGKTEIVKYLCNKYPRGILSRA